MGKVGEEVKEEKPKKKAEPERSIPQLLSDLESTEDQGEKRKIRARLRSLGHKGGARKPKEKKEKKEDAPAASKKKGKRAK